MKFAKISRFNSFNPLNPMGCIYTSQQICPGAQGTNIYVTMMTPGSREFKRIYKNESLQSIFIVY